MSDRLATLCGEIRADLETAHDRAETDAQRDQLREAAGLVKAVEKTDRERNGATPEDALAAHIDNTDECPTCGDPIDEGGWCSFSCMQEHLSEQRAD